MKIPVKIGWELLIPLNLIFLYMMFAGISEKNLSAILWGIAAILFVNYIIFSIHYRINGGFLYVKNGLFGTTKIDIQSISKISRTINPLSSPAPSLFGRVQIDWDKNHSIIISPKDFNSFKNQLLVLNPDIAVKK